MKLLLSLFFCAVLGLAYACSSIPGTTTTTTTTSTTTISSSDGEDAGLLNPSDRSIVRKTWEMSKKDGDVPPKILFRFLKAHPEYQRKFKTFANVPMDELMGNGHFLAQAYTILAGLNVIIQSMGSSELLSQEIQLLGAAHVPREVSAAMFEEFSGVIIEVLEEELGSIFDAQAKKAWQNGFRVLISGIAKNLKNKDDLPHPITKLTPHQIHDVQSSWANFRNERFSIVSSIFIKIFKETPRTLKGFAKFSSVPVDSLPSNPDFKKQTELVANRLDNMISTMENTLQIMGQIEYMAYSHIPRDVGRQRFEDFTRLLLEILQSKGVSSDNLDSWRGVMGVMINAIDKIQKH